MPRATVIVPTHAHATTVDLAIESVLAQTVADLDVVVIGDGATDEVRAAVRKTMADGRVRFLDCPKSPSRGEEARHEVLRASTAPVACYHGDDDLMLPDHVETMAALLESADFAHPLPLMVMPEETALVAYPTDLARPECVRFHLHPRRNCITLTGVTHRVDAYRRLPHGWRPPPQGRWSDHFMWEQWFRAPGMRFVTGSRLTVLKFASPPRRGMSPEARRAEMLHWRESARRPGFAAELERMAADAFRRHAIQGVLTEAALKDDLARIRATLTWRLHERVVGLHRASGLVARLRKAADLAVAAIRPSRA